MKEIKKTFDKILSENNNKFVSVDDAIDGIGTCISKSNIRIETDDSKPLHDGKVKFLHKGNVRLMDGSDVVIVLMETDFGKKKIRMCSEENEDTKFFENKLTL